MPPLFTDFTYDNLGIPKSTNPLIAGNDVDFGLGARTDLPIDPPVEAAETPSTEIPEKDLSAALAAFEKQVISAALNRCRWNRTQTARALGIGLRTLQRKMKSFGIQ